MRPMLEPMVSMEENIRTRPESLGDMISRKLWYMNAEEMIRTAQRATGLKDFGDPSIEPAFSILVNSLEKEADLHPIGRFLMRVHLRDLLATRLRLAELWQERGHRQDSIPVRRPIFITGVPRSGSTFLHELLAEDPANRAPRVWEVMFPVPNRRTRPEAPDPRIKRAAACLWWFRRFAPQADAVFPMRAFTPHECVAIHSYSFLSEEFVSTCRIPSYESFLRHTDLKPAYAWQYCFLQHLQFESRDRQWVLKSPDHVYGLEKLFQVFPDALVIQTHRNPLDVLKSSCHLTEVLHGLYAHPGSNDLLAARESRVLAEALNRFINFRDDHPELADRFIDVKYEEVTSNPLAAVRRIYEKFDLRLTDMAVERMRTLASGRARYGNGRARGGAHEFRPGNTAEAPSFERYCSRFKINWQQSQA